MPSARAKFGKQRNNKSKLASCELPLSYRVRHETLNEALLHVPQAGGQILQLPCFPVNRHIPLWWKEKVVIALQPHPALIKNCKKVSCNLNFRLAVCSLIWPLSAVRKYFYVHTVYGTDNLQPTKLMSAAKIPEEKALKIRCVRHPPTRG